MIRDAYQREILRAAAQIRADERAARKASAPKLPPRKLGHKRVEPAKDGRQRQPRVRSAEHLAFIRRLPCVICTLLGDQPKPSQAAHVRAGYPEAGWRPTGMQERPDDSRSAPLCQHHHLDGPKAQHKANERAWWAEWGIHPPDLCADLTDAFPDAGRGAEVIKQHCIRAMSEKLRRRL